MSGEISAKQEPKQYSIMPILAIIVVVVGLYSVFNSEPTTITNEPTIDYSAQRDAVAKRYNGAQEPTTQIAQWVGERIFVVKVIDNQGNRNGYAQSVCQTLIHYQLNNQGINVQVLAHTPEHKVIGYASCN